MPFPEDSGDSQAFVVLNTGRRAMRTSALVFKVVERLVCSIAWNVQFFRCVVRVGFVGAYEVSDFAQALVAVAGLDERSPVLIDVVVGLLGARRVGRRFFQKLRIFRVFEFFGF